jgi:phospholipase C
MAIDHVFVLMLENRSFDHFFGLSGLPGVPRPGDARFGPGATDRCSVDPPHEFPDVQTQIAGGAMTGFDGAAWQGFTPDQVPVIAQLAREFVLFDNWFSSVPGPTWPNRFFVHAASSGGLSTSPSQFQSSGAVIGPSSPFRFKNGSIFDRLDQHGLKWRVYHGDVHPQMLALPGMVKRYLSGTDNFCPTMGGDPHFSDFATDVADANYAPAYTFIEPDYAIQVGSQFRFGDSQHPKGLVSAGEALIKVVYEALRAAPLWQSSLLLVTWDEHGGFHDHVPPGPATPPGDVEYNRPTDGSDSGFRFDRLGVRVPALLVSPWVPRGVLGSQLFPGAVFDHSSVVKSVIERFALGAPLTARDGAAPGWNSGLLTQPRADAASGPQTLPAPVAGDAAVAPPPAPAVLDGTVAGTALNALAIDRALSASTGRPTIARSGSQAPADYQRDRKRSLKSPQFPLQMTEYINAVGVRAQAHRLRVRQAKAGKP